jgi:hypothetical protein
MAKYSDIKGFTVQTVTSDPAASIAATGSWASGTSMPSVSGGRGMAGAYHSSIAYGGTGSPSTAAQGKTEYFDGTSWSEQNDLNTARFMGCPAKQGTQTAALFAAGSSGSDNANVESWNGSSWSEVNDVPTAKHSYADGLGTQTAALAVGAGPPNRAIVSSWDGSNWTDVAELNTGRYFNSCSGSQTAGLCFAGDVDNTFTANTESWNGSTWTELNNLNTVRATGGGAGTQTSALMMTGNTAPGPLVANVEVWDGTSWTEVADVSTARNRPGSTGANSTAAIVAGGYSPSIVANVEEWTTTPSALFQKTVEGQLYFNSTTNTFKETLFVISDGTWASGGSLNDGRSSFTGIGIQTAVVAASGQDGSTSLIDSVEEYNGTVWTEVNDTPVTLKYPGAGGVLTAGWLAGGLSAWNGATFNAETYEYDGTNWTDSGNINTSRYTAYGGGPQTAAFIAGGNNTSFAAVDDTELYDGSSWTEVADLNTARANGFGNGTQTDGIFAGGSPGTKTEAETWDGTSWTEVSELNTGRYSIGVGGGTAPGSSVLAAGGATDPGNVNNVESWNGTSWTERAELAATNSSNGLGISGVTSAISFGGFSPTPSTFAVTSEHWTVDLSNKTITAS